ncbi:MAG: hypothetical protein JRJ60_23045 [Deltaproteobacteria bacterium]|nr:hypothetical protein [Deltaproteobacteria bacterium]
MNSKKVFTTLGLIPALVIALAGPASAKDIVHDAEYYILDAQNGEKWAAEDIGLDKKLAELKKKFGTPPNIIHIMWDDKTGRAKEKIRHATEHHPHHVGRHGLWRHRHPRHSKNPWI